MHCTELSCLFSFLWVEIFSVFLCLSQPWLFWRVLARHFAEYPSIWVCLRQRWLNMFPGRSGGAARSRTRWRRTSRNALLGKDPQRVTLAQSHREVLQTVWVTPQSCLDWGAKAAEYIPPATSRQFQHQLFMHTGWERGLLQPEGTWAGCWLVGTKNSKGI